MDSLKKNLSYQLKEYRRQNKLSQEKAAESLGISTVFYGEIEREKRVPSTKLLIHLCRKIGCEELALYPMPPDENIFSEDTARLLRLIKSHPELTEVLLPIAENLISD